MSTLHGQMPINRKILKIYRNLQNMAARIITTLPALPDDTENTKDPGNERISSWPDRCSNMSSQLQKLTELEHFFKTFWQLTFLTFFELLRE